MNNHKILAKIQLIETKIQEIKSTLKLWTQEIETYHTTLKDLTQQLNEIKKSLNINQKYYANKNK